MSLDISVKGLSANDEAKKAETLKTIELLKSLSPPIPNISNQFEWKYSDGSSDLFIDVRNLPASVDQIRVRLSR